MGGNVQEQARAENSKDPVKDRTEGAEANPELQIHHEPDSEVIQEQTTMPGTEAGGVRRYYHIRHPEEPDGTQRRDYVHLLETVAAPHTEDHIRQRY